jgi:hypothetical protein
MNQFVISGTLAPRHRDVGLELTENDHTLELKDREGNSIAQFSATGVTIEEIYREADRYIEKQATKRGKRDV